MSHFGVEYTIPTIDRATQNVRKGSQNGLTNVIGAALPLLFKNGQVIEIRALRVDGKKQTASGYFDDPVKLAKAAADYSGRAQAVYFTLNPVKPALLARAANRIKPYAETTTSDHDVIRRQWLGIDFDPVRPADISSSDEEHLAALERALICKNWLTEQGWPDPIFADSGNGAHLLYQIDLPNDEAAVTLLKNVLAALAAHFDDDQVKVDPGVFNASRIWKLYGTMACKGDNVPDRPHRQANIIAVPTGETCEQVVRELLENLAAQAPKAEPKRPAQPSRTAPNHDGASHDHSVIDEIKERLDMVSYAQKSFPGSPREESRGEVRILGNGGLFINPDKGTWYHFSNGQGGDAIDLVGYVTFGESWDHSDRRMFREALKEASVETGVPLPERSEPVPKQQSASKQPSAPNDGLNIQQATPTKPLPPPILRLPHPSDLEQFIQNSQKHLYYREALKHLRLPGWLMNFVVPKQSVGLLWGSSGIGKSFITLHIALTNAVHSPTLYVANEGFLGYGDRIRAWEAHNKLDPQYIALRKELDLMSEYEITMLIAQLEYEKFMPTLIVIDSLAGAMVGADDNSSKDAGIVTANLRRLSEATGASVLVVHHPTKDGRTFRGSGSWYNNFDYVIGTEQEDDEVIVRCDKMKDFDPFPEQRVTFIPVDIGLPDRKGRVVVPADKVVRTKDDPLSPLQRRIAELLASEPPGDGLSTGEMLEMLRVGSSSLHAALSKLKKFNFVEQERKGADYMLTETGRKALSKNPDVAATSGVDMTRLFFPHLSGDIKPPSNPSPTLSTPNNGVITGNSTSPMEIVDTSPQARSTPNGSLLFDGASPKPSPMNSNIENAPTRGKSIHSNVSPMNSNGDDQRSSPQLHALPPSLGGRDGELEEMEESKIEYPPPMPYAEIVKHSVVLPKNRQAAFLAIFEDSPTRTDHPTVTGAEIDDVLASVTKDEAEQIELAMTERGITLYYSWIVSGERPPAHFVVKGQPILLAPDDEVESPPNKKSYYSGEY